ncbi:MAG TPA: alpha/beta fold hydrolase [Pirellulales bacterium]|jgi:homoserine O-acetyltransferase
MSSHEIFEIANFELQRGVTLPCAQLAYKTYGNLNADRSNTILYPTSYAATHGDIDWLIGRDRILDPQHYFIVVVNAFGNGVSSSPSNLPAPYNRFDLFTHVDNVRAQRKMLTERFGVQRLALAYGWSMGAQQALHWGAIYPDSVARIAAICGSAKTSPHNWVFLEGLRTALTADPAWDGQRFTAKPERGLRAFGRIYAGWALSQAFFRQHLYRSIGFESLEDCLVRDWEASFLRRDPANLLSMINTWQRSDVSDNDLYRGDIDRALGAIRATTLIMPSETDLYFTPEDSEAEAQRIPNARFLPIPSIWGHRAGNPAKNPVDERFIRAAIEELLIA